MNRELKFRAFDKLTNKMVVTGFHIFGEVTMFGVLSTHIFENLGNKEYGSALEMELARQDDIVIMQYTGLKDKNGKEIYEGDIIRSDTSGHYWKVCFGYSFNFTGWYGQSVGNGEKTPINTDFQSDINSAIALVGNIHENPEILQS